MRKYKISFRVLEPINQDVVGMLANIFTVDFKTSTQIVDHASKRDDFKLVVTAEQLGNLQALRVIKKLHSEIRYLADCVEIKPKKVDHKIFDVANKIGWYEGES